MDKATKKLSELVSDSGISFMHLSRKTGIPYVTIYHSLSPKNGKRSLKGDELLLLCKVLQIDPKELYE